VNGSNSNVEQVNTHGVSPESPLARTTHGNRVALGTLATIGIVGVLFLFNPSQHNFYPVCLFHEATGLLCPGCGSLRALHQLLHGNVADAFRFNPLLVLSLPLVLAMTVRFLAQKTEPQSPRVRLRLGWMWALLAVLVVFGVLRNLPLAPLSWLAR
jgi:drug/metabolite transporter (DMT)-like permease